MLRRRSSDKSLSSAARTATAAAAKSGETSPRPLDQITKSPRDTRYEGGFTIIRLRAEISFVNVIGLFRQRKIIVTWKVISIVECVRAGRMGVVLLAGVLARSVRWVRRATYLCCAWQYSALSNRNSINVATDEISSLTYDIEYARSPVHYPITTPSDCALTNGTRARTAQLAQRKAAKIHGDGAARRSGNGRIASRRVSVQIIPTICRRKKYDERITIMNERTIGFPDSAGRAAVRRFG
ncbi:hypothetical protein EVAR_98038_1 [Eumeta japonica]|uniref:Uncharacterized protein n=1 Tax=Eumeta variegata TaxID=151549 RepID=A0A4C1ZRS2_EUMVA|nr:hypothetical protein EVAR_98038_1 [Eumeta japonica]